MTSESDTANPRSLTLPQTVLLGAGYGVVAAFGAAYYGDSRIAPLLAIASFLVVTWLLLRITEEP